MEDRRDVGLTDVGEADPVGRVDVEWLGLGVIRAAGGRVADCHQNIRMTCRHTVHLDHTVADAHASDEAGDGSRVKHIADHTVRFTLEEPAFGSTSYNTARILSAMLQERQTLPYLRRSVQRRIMQQQTKYTAHCVAQARIISTLADLQATSRHALFDVKASRAGARATSVAATGLGTMTDTLNPSRPKFCPYKFPVSDAESAPARSA